MILPERISAIQHYPRLTNLRSLRRFIGMVGYYARFIPDYSHKAAVTRIEEEMRPVCLA
jgi:hypothetical protein